MVQSFLQNVEIVVCVLIEKGGISWSTAINRALSITGGIEEVTFWCSHQHT